MQLPLPSGRFCWRERAVGPALESSLLAGVTAHLFTTRLLRLRADNGDAPAGWEAIAEALGVNGDRVVRLKQVHGRNAIVVKRGEDIAALVRHPPEADILVTDDPSIAIAVQVADCVPLLIADPTSGAVAAAHAGWRGTAAGVAPAAIASLGAHFGSRPANLVAAIGPSIGPCCYQVGPDVLDAFAAAHGRASLDSWFGHDVQSGDGPRYRLDVWAANRDQLVAAGVRPENIDIARLCTATCVDVLCSYRREGKAAGRMAGAIRAAG